MRRARKARTSLRWLLQLGLPLLAGAMLFVGVFYSGRLLGERLKGQDKVVLYFSDLECESPPGLSHAEFLHEVQYLADLPDRLELLEGETPARIARALALHPWVAKVKQVKLSSMGAVRAELVFREPILAAGAPARVVDGSGILLPRGASTKGLPLLTTKVVPPDGPPGKPWADVRVQAAAQVVGLLRPRLDALGLTACRVSVRDGEVTLETDRCRLLWGRPPEQEKVDEAQAVTKLRRLPEIESLVGWEWDVRPTNGIKKQRFPTTKK